MKGLDMIGESSHVIRNYFLQLTQSLERLTDHQLLERFIDQNDQEAFATIVQRHGPMVLGTCRRILGFTPETEDVFQATFLSLTRYVRSIHEQQIGGWLYRVAFRLASRTKKQFRVTIPLEESVGESTGPGDELSLREAKQVLDEELNRLPDRFRDPLILCYLQGCTRDEAAKQLGCSLAMLKRRLETGRERLRTQLTRRGLAPALVLVAISGTSGFSIQVPNRLIQSTLHFAEKCSSKKPIPDSIARLVSSSSTGAFSFFRTIAITLLFGSVLLFGGSYAGNVDAKSNEPNQAEKKDFPKRLSEVDSSLETPLPPRVLHRLGSSRFRHTDGINCSSISAGGKILATAAKRSVAIWNTETGQMIRIFRDCGIPDGFGEMTLALSPDGKTIAHRADHEVAIRIWDIPTGKQIGTIGTNPPRLNGVGIRLPVVGPREKMMFHGVRFSPDGKQLWVDGLLKDQQQIEVYRVENTKLEKSFPLQGELHQIHFEKQFALLQLQTNQNANNRNNSPSYAVLDLTKNKEICRMEVSSPGKGWGSKAKISLDGKKLAVIDGYRKLSIWDIPSGKQSFETELEEKAVTERNGLCLVNFAPDSRSVFAGTSSGGVYQFNLTTKKLMMQWQSAQWAITGLHPTPDGKQLITTSWDQMIRRWDLASGKEILPPEGYSRSTRAKYSADGKSIYVCDSGNGRIDQWDATTGKRIRQLVNNQPGISNIAVSSSGEQLATGHMDGHVRIWDCNTGKLLTTLEGKQSSNRWFSSIAFHPQKKRLYSVDREVGITCWNLTTAKSLWSLPYKDSPVVALSPDGKTLISGGWNSILNWHDSESGKELVSEKVPSLPSGGGTFIDCIAFAPDGKSFLTTHHDGGIRIWDMTSRKPIKVLEGHQGVVWQAEFSLDGKWILSSSGDHTIRIWEVVSGKEIDCLKGHDGWVWSADFGTDNRQVASSSGTEVFQWDLIPPEKPIQSMSEMWERLAVVVGSRAYRAIWSLSKSPKESIAFLREKIHPIAKPDPEQVRKWVRQLGNDRFTERESAKKKLLELGEPIKGTIRTSLKETSDPDMKERLKLILDELTREPNQDDIRQMRVIKGLELSNTPQAKKLLTEWAEGATGASLTEEAAQAIQRMDALAKRK